MLTAQAINVKWMPQDVIRAPQLHWNEDYHSVPDPLRGATQMSSTWAKYIKNGQTDFSIEAKGTNYKSWVPYNRDA